MSRSGKKRTSLDMGHDAFLDIVANLVGILIILVVVLGTQSTAAIREIKEQAEQDAVVDTIQGQLASDAQLTKLAEHSMRAAAAQADSIRFEKMVARFDSEIEMRRRQRGELLDLLSEAEAAWEEMKQELDSRATRLAQQNIEFEQTQREIAKLRSERENAQPTPIVAVAHLPTPMAKTVFGDELHFRLKGNRLSVVPIEKLLEEIRRDFERVASRSRDGRLDASVGPVRGYVAQYTMDKNREMVARGGSVGMATRIQLVGMKVQPLQEPYGQPIQKVFAGSSELDIELAGRDPGSTSITVWVYPDSFAAFRRLKEHLYAKGFATAARPLPMDREITGGPQGTRSSAQ